MNISRRGWFVAGVASAVSFLNAGPLSVLRAEDAVDSRAKVSSSREKEEAQAKGAAATAAPGELTDETLGRLLETLTLKPTKTETRYDFTFASKTKVQDQDQDWTLTMSAVLSQDKKTIWIMAWLDELPRSAKDVPRTALLGLLAENDKMGKGQFFSYIPTNRRFVLQQVVENKGMTTSKFRALLVDLGHTVSLTYPQWTVSNWKDNPNPIAENETDSGSQTSPAGTAPGTSQKTPQAGRTAVGDSPTNKVRR